MAEIPRGNRPLSPHLSVYRLPLAAITSILNRATGQGMLPAILLILWWLLAAGISDEAFARADWVLTSWLGLLVLFGGLWSLWFHFLAGIRHFFYDARIGMEISSARMSSIAILVGSVLLSLLTLLLMA